MEMYKQKSKWAVRSVLCTVAVVALFLGLGLFFMRDGGNDVYIAFFLWGLLALLCLAAMCFYPLEVQVGEGSLNIAFPLRNKTIPLAEIVKAEPYQVTMNFVRLMGSGAFFGWWGWFVNQELGRFMVYATDLDHVFHVELRNGRKYVISCSDPEAMCSAIRRAMNP